MARLIDIYHNLASPNCGLSLSSPPTTFANLLIIAVKSSRLVAPPEIYFLNFSMQVFVVGFGAVFSHSMIISSVSGPRFLFFTFNFEDPLPVGDPGLAGSISSDFRFTPVEGSPGLAARLPTGLPARLPVSFAKGLPARLPTLGSLLMGGLGLVARFATTALPSPGELARELVGDASLA